MEAALALAKVAMKQQFDKHRSESRDYKPGDLVWLEGTNIKTQRPAVMSRAQNDTVTNTIR